MNDLLSIEQFAKLHLVSTQAIYYKIKTKQLEYIILGKTKFIKNGTQYNKRAKNKTKN